MSWKRDYRWLLNFWDDVVTDRLDRVWQLNVLHNADLWLRDAMAWGLLSERMLTRGNRFDRSYVRAWAAGTQVPVAEMANRDLIFLGRTKAFDSSRLAPWAHALGSNMLAEFVDGFDGRAGNCVKYAGRTFQIRELDTPPGQPRRVDLDYGVIGFRETDVFGIRRLMVFSGLTTLGTLGTTLVLVDDERRAELVSQVREVAPWNPKHRPEESFEICIRFHVDGQERLANSLNDPAFAFRVEAVAIAGVDTPYLREERLDLLVHLPVMGRRGTVSLPGSAELPIKPAPFQLLSHLVRRNGEATPEELAADLNLLQGTEDEETKKRVRGHIAKTVHDLNQALRLLPGLPPDRVVQMRGKHYVLTGVRGVLAPAPARLIIA